MSNEPDARRPRRHWGKRIGALAVVLALIGVGAGWLYDGATERPRVLAAIEAAGGRCVDLNSEPFFVRSLARLLGQANVDHGYDLFLDGPQFDDEWLAAQNNLRAIRIEQLLARDTNLSRDAIARLLGGNELTSFIVPGVPLTDEDAQRLGEQQQLTNLTLTQSKITDAGLAALKPGRLRALDVSGTRVTSAALQQELTGRSLQFLGLDGKQFTPELAAQLAGLKSLTMIRLAGPDVTDAHVRLVETMPNVHAIAIDQTSATPAAIESLRAAKPNGDVMVLDADTTIFKWRAE